MTKNFFSSFALLSTFICFVFLHSCSSHSNHALRHELSGRGVLPLDLSNPYLAPNMFLSEEAKYSETLKGFLSLKGAPELLEFSESIIGGPKLKLIYKSKNESYILEGHGKDWIINGPNSLEEDEEVSAIVANSTNKTPPPLLPGRESTASPIILPTPLDQKSEASSIPGTASPNTEKTAEVVSASRPTFKDVYHEVNLNGETISFLSYWFTGSIQNRERIQRINASLKENLRRGEIVRIPSYLAKKESSPTQDDLDRFNRTGK